MVEYIDKAAAIESLGERPLCWTGGDYELGQREQWDSDVRAVEAVPAVDVVQVVHGRWETVEDWDGDEHYKCSVCGAEFVLIDGDTDDNDYLYCPHCGARMDERDGERHG